MLPRSRATLRTSRENAPGAGGVGGRGWGTGGDACARGEGARAALWRPLAAWRKRPLGEKTGGTPRDVPQGLKTGETHGPLSSTSTHAWGPGTAHRTVPVAAAAVPGMGPGALPPTARDCHLPVSHFRGAARAQGAGEAHGTPAGSVTHPTLSLSSCGCDPETKKADVLTVVMTSHLLETKI